MKKYQLANNGQCRCVENNIYSSMNPLKDKAGNHYWGESFGTSPVLASNHSTNGISLVFDETWKDEIPDVSEAYELFEAFRKKASV